MPVATNTEVDTTALDRVLAERYVREHMESKRAVEWGRCAHEWVQCAAEVVEAFEVSIERKDGLRRVVLAGRWEVDPAAH